VYERERDGTPSFTGFATFADLRDRTQTLRHIAAVGSWQPTIFGEHDAEQVQGQRVSWSYFRVLGVRPLLGRDFERVEDTPGNNGIVILGHGLWTRRFGGDARIIGQKIDIDGVPHTVVGVLPASFDNALQPTAQMWTTLAYATQPWACRTCRHLQVVARLRDGVTKAQATRELDGLAIQLAAAYPKDYPAAGAVVVGLQDRVTRNARPILIALLGAVALVLLIGIANVVNLQLARAVRRHEEFAVRAALGAGRVRLARQLFAEGLVLSTLGGIAGIAFAAFMLPVLVSRLPETLPRLSAIRLDWQALGLVGVIALVVGIAAGVVPALHAGRQRLFTALRGSSRALGGAHHRVRSALVVGEVALAMMLMFGAALLGRSLQRLVSVDAGFDPSHLVTMQVQATGTAYSTPGSVFTNHDRILDAVRRLPGVVDAGLTSQLPLGGNFDRYGVAARDKPLENPELAPSADRYAVSANYLRAMRIPILRGRGFTEADARDSSGRAAIISDALAKRIWPGEDAIGKFIRLGGPTRPWREVIGIVGNVRHTGLDATVTQQVYIPERQWFFEESAMTLVARTATDPAQMAQAVREAVRGVDPRQPIARIATMESVVARSTAQRRLGLLLFVSFSTIALLLASAGIYGVLAGSVAERMREFGLRSALGASPRSLLRLVLSQGAKFAVIGLVLGSAATLSLSRFLRALLFGIAASDPVAMAFAVLLIALVSLAACVVPARRALRADPMAALRAE
jgi:putative ABC transport system permease protein